MASKDAGNVRYWEERAEEALARASEMHDPDAIATMRVIAERYKRMARRIAERKAEGVRTDL